MFLRLAPGASFATRGLRVLKDLETPAEAQRAAALLSATLCAEATLLRDAACPAPSCPSYAAPPPYVPASFELPPAEASDPAAAAAMEAVAAGRAGGYAPPWAPRDPAYFFKGVLTSRVAPGSAHLAPPPHARAPAGAPSAPPAWQWVGGHLQHAVDGAKGSAKGGGGAGSVQVIPATRLGDAALTEPVSRPAAAASGAHMEWE